MTSKVWNSDSMYEAVKQAASVLVVTHLRPDGDAIGSLLGLGLALRGLGKPVTLAVDGGVPDFLRYLPEWDSVMWRLRSGDWDLMISVDASDVERMGEVGKFGREHSQRLLNMDHHSTNTLFGEDWLIDPEMSSAAEVVYRWLVEIGLPITQPIATALLTGVVTDTIGFRTANVTADTLDVAQALMRAGASLPDIVARTLVGKPYKMLDLWRYALPTVDLKGKIVSAVVSWQSVQKAGFDDALDGGLVGLLASVEEAVIAVVYKEHGDGKVQLSMRSKQGYDIGAVALSLGGGGHKQAAGAMMDGPIEAAQARVMPLLEQVVSAGDASV